MRICLLALVLVSVAPRPAQAALRYALYPLGSLALEPQDLLRVERALVAGLAVVPETRVIERKAVDRVLSERKGAHLALCEGDLACLVAVGKALGVDRIITGEAGGLAAGYVVYLRLVDVRAAKEMRAASATLRSDERGLRASAREAAFRLIAPERHVGWLAVRADVTGATVFVDGRPVARTPAPSTELAVGTHALRVSHDAYRDFLRFIDIGFEQTTEVEAGLTAFPVIADELRARGQGARDPGEDGRTWYRRWWAVTAFGLIVAGATAGLIVGTVDRVGSDYHAVVSRPR
jgi:hypothetical protein